MVKVQSLVRQNTHLYIPATDSPASRYEGEVSSRVRGEVTRAVEGAGPWWEHTILVHRNILNTNYMLIRGQEACVRVVVPVCPCRGEWGLGRVGDVLDVMIRLFLLLVRQLWTQTPAFSDIITRHDTGERSSESNRETCGT